MDKFRGTLTQEQAAAILTRNLNAHVTHVPVSDGGEGFLDCVQRFVPGLKKEEIEVAHPSGHGTHTAYVLTSDTRAYLEVAQLAGHHLLGSERDIFTQTSAPVGDAIKHCYGQGVRSFVIGVGGSVFSDAGLGCLNSMYNLGHKLRDIKKIDHF
mgnify:CR=1 FL=1